MGDCQAFSDLFFVERSRWDSPPVEGHKTPTIARFLLEESAKVSRVAMLKFLAQFEEAGSIGRRIGSG